MDSSKTINSSRRIGGIAGIVFGLGAFLALMLLGGDQPLASDPIGDIRSFAIDNDTEVFLFNWSMGALFVFAFLIFASALRSVLAPADDESGMWSRASFAGAVATVAVVGAGAAFTSALVLNVDDYSDSTLRALMNLDVTLYTTIMPWGLALFLTGASIVILRSGVLWKWLGWLGLVAALVMVIGTFWVIDGDEEGFLGILVWIGITATLLWSLLSGVAMIRSARGR